ncbi:NADP-dependent oxidoreductase [Streptodolium elevatio]
MRAVQIDRFGGPEVLRLREVPEPAPGPEEVLVRNVATSINPVDDKTREGAIGEGAPPLPMTLGWDLAGIVVDGGETGWQPGERVIAMSHQLDTGRGTWSELVAIPAHALAAAPTTTSLVEAATLPLPGLSALQTLAWLSMQPGERLLIAGAGGAVGGLALQIAVSRGIHVDALIARDAHVAFAREHGASVVTTDRTTLEIHSYHAVLDTFGAFVTDAVADGGRYASIATQAGPVPDLSDRGIRTTVHQVTEDGTGLGELARLVDTGAVQPRIDTTFGPHTIHSAHKRFAQGNLNGKVTLAFEQTRPHKATATPLD